MARKQMIWKPKGMNKDLSVSAFNPEFVYENKNLRLSTNENNTLLSWVNEKGTESIFINGSSISGIPVGTAILNHQLVLFTTKPAVYNGTALVTAKTDYIYKLTNLIWASNSVGQTNTRTLTMSCTCLYFANLGFSTEWPLETLVSYEADHIQKVYWTDGLNQPRVINIADTTTLNKWQGQNLTTCFDFVPAINGGTISVAKATASSGTFAPGVIQYCFTYYNKYGQQSNIVDVSPLYYLTHSERGASPEDKVTSSFEITLSGYDTNFDYIRLYSIQRTSLNDTPIVKLLDDIEMPANNDTALKYIDNGTTGSMMDPTELLFIGGKEISALTMTDKDNTLFLGNIEQKDSNISAIQSHYKNWQHDGSNESDITFTNVSTNSVPIAPDDIPRGIYSYSNQLDGRNSRTVTTFKGGDKYRFGFQLQKKNGEWTEPIFLKDKTNDVYPNAVINNSGTSDTATVSLVQATATVNINNNNIKTTYKKIRPLIVHPTISDRNVLCQGVLNPTVFNIQDRRDNSPFAQASWFFRPYANVPPSSPSSGEGSGESSGSGSGSNSHDFPTSEVYNYGDVQNQIPNYNLWVQSINNELDRSLNYRSVYVLKASFGTQDNPSTEGYQNVIRRGSIRMKVVRHSTTLEDDSEFEYVDIPIWGVIEEVLDGQSTGAYYFLSSQYFPEPGGVSGADMMNTDFEPEVTAYVYMDSLNVLEKTSEPFSIRNDLRVDGNLKIFYGTESTDQNASAYVFKFGTPSNAYIVTFPHNPITIHSIDDEPASSSSEHRPRRSGRMGTTLRFKHFDSIFCQSEIEENDPYYEAKQVEIQGSMKLYDTPFVAPEVKDFWWFGCKPKEDGANVVGNNPNVKSCTNTQFFIDQSIVTLNSPDLEFDTEAQTWGTEGLNLRIVGYIPITANASYHKMTTSSAMLPTSGSFTFAKSGLIVRDYYKSYTGSGEQAINVSHSNMSSQAQNRLISDFLWQDSIIVPSKSSKDEGGIITGNNLTRFVIFPWHREGSLNNDFRPKGEASSTLNTKKESQILFSANSIFSDNSIQTFDSIKAQMVYTENAEVMNYRLNVTNGPFTGLNYYPNIDKVLYNEYSYPVLYDIKDGRARDVYTDEDIKWVTTPVSMKYKSTSHIVLSLNNKILPSLRGAGAFSNSNNPPFWSDSAYSFTQNNITDGTNDTNPINPIGYSFLWLGELYKTVTNPFGGDSDTAIRNNKWVIGGPTVSIEENSNTVNLVWTEGDTYYQRYDCLKTYPFTTEDPNQIVEILSFMCETHVNLDGRYDRNRGQQDNTNMHPKNFNLLNPVYSQRNNFFTYKCLLPDPEENQRYPNQIFYTKTKTSGADVDLWTNVTLASTLELDGDKGALNKLTRFNDQLIAFQDRGISQILYNENTQISTTAGVPIEIANSGKVQGKRYLSDTIGCSNKWSVVSTPSGIYFMDNNDKSIYLFNGQLTNLSVQGGMNTWSKQNIQPVKGISTKWTPDGFGNFVSYYDTQNQDVMFINGSTSLHWSEKLGTFTSFYDYGHTPYFCTLDGNGIWVRNNSNNATLYGHQMGDYCNFFGTANSNYWMTLVGNPEPQLDKIFTNLEFRACVDGEFSTKTVNNETVFDKPYIPFNSLETWNEYQHGIANIGVRDRHASFLHHSSAGNNPTLKRKFRLWRCDIPRDNASPNSDSSLNITREKAHPNDRMRNPWLYLKLLKSSDTGNRTEIHDIMMTYFG